MVHLTTFAVMLLCFTCSAVILAVSNLVYWANGDNFDSPWKVMLMQWGLLIGAFVFLCIGKAFGFE